MSRQKQLVNDPIDMLQYCGGVVEPSMWLATVEDAATALGRKLDACDSSLHYGDGRKSRENISLKGASCIS